MNLQSARQISLILIFPKKVLYGAPERLSFELFLPWIHNLMLAYQEQKDIESDEFTLKESTFSTAYYTRKVN